MFVDVASFFKYAEGEPWTGYRQFCQMFLYPLLVQAYRDVPFQPWMRGNIDGMDAEVCLKPFSARATTRVPASLRTSTCRRRRRRRTTRRRATCAKDLSKAGFDKRIIKANAERLRALVAGLQWKPKQTTWSDYLKCGHYEASDAEQKRAFVREVAAHARLEPGVGHRVQRRRVFAHRRRAREICRRHGRRPPGDRQALPGAEIRDASPNILPLIVNVTDPSPNLGWRNMERKRIDERGRPDLVLALALIHHVVIGGQHPDGRVRSVAAATSVATS